MVNIIKVTNDKYVIDFGYDEIIIVADYDKSPTGKILWKVSSECVNRYGLTGHKCCNKNFNKLIEYVISSVEVCCENMLSRIKAYKNENNQI